MGLGAHRSCDLYVSDQPEDGVYRVTRLPVQDASMSSSSLWILSNITQRYIVERAREQFLFTATHELRTPIANIRAYAETLALAEDINAEDQKGLSTSSTRKLHD